MPRKMTAERLPIKICFIAPKAYPLFDPKVKAVIGGAEVDLYFLATELAKDKKFDVIFITADYGQGECERIEGVRVFKSLNFGKNVFTDTLKVWYAMKTADAQIYFQEAASWGTFLIALFCKLHRRTFIFRTAHTNDCDGTYLKQHLLGGKAFLWSLKQAAQVVVQNETDKTQIKQTARISSTVIPNAHPLPVLAQGQRDTILWVGRSTPLKRPGLFIDLAKQMPGEYFTMICQRATGDRDYEGLRERAGKLTNLEFISRVAFDQTGRYYERAKIFVNTSDSEGFPNTYVEACKYATPILALSVNPDDFLRTYKCGLCADDSWAKFVEQFEFLVHSQEAQNYGANGRKYAEEKHDIKRIIEEYKKLLFALVADSSANGSRTHQNANMAMRRHIDS